MPGSALLLLLACDPAQLDPKASDDTGGPAELLADVVINEFQAANETGTTDATGAREDWLELHNHGNRTVSLAGWTASDDLDEPDKHELAAELSIPAGGFLLLFASGAPERGADHLDFKLDRDGEAIGIYGPEGQPVDQLEYGTQLPDQSAARMPDASADWQLTDSPTPGESNSHG
jgi:hypothetical protein